MHVLNENNTFPEVSKANEDGLLAIGGNLSPKRLIYAYKHGIFPWYSNEEPILWWSPDPRFVLFPKDLKLSKSMKQVLRNHPYKITVNKDFKSVITICSTIKRLNQKGTWITKNMVDAYCKLHHLGYAKSVEVWYDNSLVGGLYGIDTNNGVFCGESMFSKKNNASKIALIYLIKAFNYRLIDCQLHTNHLERLGAKHISRQKFLTLIKE